MKFDFRVLDFILFSYYLIIICLRRDNFLNEFLSVVNIEYLSIDNQSILYLGVRGVTFSRAFRKLQRFNFI